MVDLGLEARDLIVSAMLFAVLAWITWSDLESLRIPDLASVPLIAMGLGLAAFPDGIGLQDASIGAAMGYLFFAIPGGWFYRTTGQDGLGLGDAKLLAAAGAWLGWRSLPLLVALAAVAALAFALLARKRRLAFGPWLSGAFWILWLRHIAA
ncbi:prepilin peptidase [Sulfitobacter sp. JB4-11]|uniref:prepilin peptidase n=1 Tax=Sulfitobacter rhodophyticola TaxID=3238304 RepID=UPI003514EDA1